MQNDLLKKPFNNDLDLLFGMDRLDEDRIHPRSFGSPYVGKELVTDKKRLLLRNIDQAARPLISPGRGLIGIPDILGIDSLRKGLHAGSLIIRNEADPIADSMEPLEQLQRSLIRRRAVRDERVVDIKRKPPIPLLVKTFEVDHIRGIHPLIRIKPGK